MILCRAVFDDGLDGVQDLLGVGSVVVKRGPAGDVILDGDPAFGDGVSCGCFGGDKLPFVIACYIGGADGSGCGEFKIVGIVGVGGGGDGKLAQPANSDNLERPAFGCLDVDIIDRAVVVFG